jgi:predicted transposase YdaD
LGRDVGQVRVVDADLSTITSDADKIFLVEAPKPWMVHVELVSARRGDLPLRVQRYNILVRYRHRLPVQSVVVLLRRAADEPKITGVVEDRLPDGSLYHYFRYDVVRAWELLVEAILAGDIATLPLAPISRVSLDELPSVIKRMQKRFNHDASPGDRGDLWAATYVLMGLVYPESIAKSLLLGVRAMKESVTYQAILSEGKVEGKIEEAKRILLLQGAKRFGHPKAATKAKIEKIADLARLEQLIDRILDAKSWVDLMSDS